MISIQKTYLDADPITQTPAPSGFDWMINKINSSVCTGSAIGMLCYVCYALLFEFFAYLLLKPPGAMLSHGQQFGLVMLPLSSLLGGGAGASISLFESRCRHWPRVITAAIPLLIGYVVTLLWKESISFNGTDRSDWILYVPLLAGSAICVVLNVVLAVRSFSSGATSQSIDADGRLLLSNLDSMKCLGLALFWMFRIVIIMFFLMPLGIFAPIIAVLVSRGSSPSVS